MRPCCAPSSWVGGSVARGCAVGRDDHVRGGCPAPLGRAATVPDIHARSAEADRVHRMVVRYKQSVIAGCKPVLPKLPPAET
ncbi:hypothetical protein GCM10009536_17670 [Streptomyces thermocarboxydus]